MTVVMLIIGMMVVLWFGDGRSNCCKDVDGGKALNMNYPLLNPATQDGSTWGLGIQDTYLCTPGSRNLEQRLGKHRLTWGKS